MAQQTSEVSTTSNGKSLSPPSMYYVATTLGHQPWLDGEDILVSAGTAFKNPGKSGAEEGFDIRIPEHDRLFIDSGGFQATTHFGSEYPYSAADLFVWAEDVDADYVAGMDFACEKADILAETVEAADADAIPSIDERIERTITKQIEQYDLYTELAGREGGWSFDFVPVIQGHTPEEYRYCAERLKAAGLATEYMAIGSTCKRDSPDQILDVLDACRDTLPATEFHLFGATRRIWKDQRFWGAFASADTHAWAASHPDGGWPANKQEKREAFAAFDADIRGAIERITNQSTIGSAVHERDERAARLPGNLYGGECSFCETPIPAYGVGFEPGCTACERIERNRTIHALAREEAEIDAAIEVTATEDEHRQGSLSDGAWSEPEADTEAERVEVRA